MQDGRCGDFMGVLLSMDEKKARPRLSGQARGVKQDAGELLVMQCRRDAET